MTVNAYTADKQMNTAHITHCPFVISTFLGKIFGHTVQNMNIFRFNIYIFEKVFLHKIVITLRVRSIQTDIFVHIKSNHIFKRNLTGLV